MENPTTPIVARETLRYRGPKWSISRFLKSFWKTRVFLSGGVSISGVVVVASKILRIFCCTHKKLGGRKSGSNFAGSKTPTRLTVVYMLNIVSSKEAYLWPQKFQSTNLLSFIFVVKIQISLAKIHMQPSKNEGLLPMIFHFKGWFFKLFLLALHFSRMGEGLPSPKKHGDRNYFRSKTWLFLVLPGESEKFDLGPRMQRFGGDVAMPNGGLAFGMTISISIGKRKLIWCSTIKKSC